MTQWVVLAGHHTFDKPRIWSTPFTNKTDASSYCEKMNEALGKTYEFSVERLEKTGKRYYNGFYYDNTPEPSEPVMMAIRSEEL